MAAVKKELALEGLKCAACAGKLKQQVRLWFSFKIPFVPSRQTLRYF